MYRQEICIYSELDAIRKDNKDIPGAEITVGNHCGGEIFQNIFSEKCENVLKNLSSTVILVVISTHAFYSLQYK